MEKRLHAFVSGMVQGVFFRGNTRQWGRKLGLRGFVRNLPDGRLEVVAEGSKEKLEELLIKLNKGPPAAEVENVEAKFEEANGEFDSFEVRF